MTASHYTELSRSMNMQMLRHPLLGSWVARTRLHMQEGRYPKELVDFVFQRSRGGPTMEDAYVFSQVWAKYHTGRFYFASVSAGSLPFPDDAVKRNRDALDCLPDIFRTTVDCKLCDQDGSLSWSDSICLTSYTEAEDGVPCDCECGKAFCDIAGLFKADQVPLEIGTTSASRTLLHLNQYGGLARWPYGVGSVLIGVLCNG